MIVDRSIYSISQKACFGCSACQFICPKNAIMMKDNKEGFLYPEVNHNCINCGLCHNVCPSIDPETIRKKVIHSYAAYTDDSHVYMKSSSGGIFAACALLVLETGGIVVGAEILSDYTVTHSIITKASELPRIQGSKYVQSDISDVYSCLADYLSSGKTVLFSGTPCQVAGLINAFKAKRIPVEKLITVDIVCHGVPSPLFFKEHMQKTYGHVSNIQFRQKTRHELSGYAIGFEKDGKKRIINPTNRDFYYSCYSSQVSLRESCYQCPFAYSDRVGDISLGDLATQYGYEIGSNHACSIVAVNSYKGEKLISSLRSIVKEDADYIAEVKANAQLSHPVSRPIERDSFYSDLFDNNEYDETKAQKYRHKDSIHQMVEFFLKRITTPKSRLLIKKLLKK